MVSEDMLKMRLKQLDLNIRNTLQEIISSHSAKDSEGILNFLAANFPKAEHFEQEGNIVNIEFLRKQYVDIKYLPEEGEPKPQMQKRSPRALAREKAALDSNEPLVTTRKLRPAPKRLRHASELCKKENEAGALLKDMRMHLGITQTKAAEFLTEWAERAIKDERSICGSAFSELNVELPIKQSSISALERGRTSRLLAPTQAVAIFKRWSGLYHIGTESRNFRQAMKQWRMLGHVAKAKRIACNITIADTVTAINAAHKESDTIMPISALDIELLEAGGSLHESIDQNALIDYYKAYAAAGARAE